MRDPRANKASMASVAIVDEHRARWASQRLTSESSPSRTSLLFENRMCLSISEVAYALGLSSRMVERLIQRGELRAKAVGRRRIVLRSDIEAWLNVRSKPCE